MPSFLASWAGSQFWLSISLVAATTYPSHHQINNNMQCGNGIRCLAQFLKDLGEAPPNSSYNIDTLAGPIIPVVNDSTGTITVDMGPPILDGPSVPCTLEPNSDQNSIVEQSIDANGKSWKLSAVSMGNPHAIIFVDNLDEDVVLDKDGPALECHEAFPQKTNIEFVQVLTPTHLKMKVWERGAGPTLACGTGTCALVVAAIRAGKIPHPTGEDGSEASQVRVTLPGGDLFIEWRLSNGKLYMTGPGTRVFAGNMDL
jgi:diaminopimelate epimerase